MLDIHFGEKYFNTVLFRNLSPAVPMAVQGCFSLCIKNNNNRLKPEMLTRLPEGMALELEGSEGDVLRLERVRDVIFEAAFSQSEKMVFRVILGTENQSFVDYGMVIREMGYEAGTYGEQLKLRKRKNREEKRLKPGDEFLSDYRMNLVHAGNVTPQNFHTGLKQVFELLPFSGSGKEMERYVERNSQEFSNVSGETFELLATFFDDRDLELAKKKEQFRNKEGGGYNMCTAFREIREEGIQIGKDQGIQIGAERVNLLIQRLIQEYRMEEIERAVSDKAYQQELFIKYGI